MRGGIRARSLAGVLCQLAAALALAWGAVGCATVTERHQGQGLEVHTFRQDYNNTFLLVQGSHMVLVDAGLPATAEALDAQLREAGFDPARIEAVIITHGHADHAGGALHFQRRYGAKVIAGLADRGMLSTGHNEPLCPTGSLAESRLEDDQGATYEPTEADVWIEQEAVALESVSGVQGRIIPVPGHTPGSLLVVTADVAVVGDLFRGAIVGGGAEVHFYMCDLAGNRADIRRLLDELAPGATDFFTGHFGPVSREDVEALLEEPW